MPAFLGSSIVAALMQAAALSSSDLQRLETYSAAWSTPDNAQEFTQRARAEFGGRGLEIANQFLIHTDPRPRNDAYFFVLRAVGDTETALTLIRAFPDSPAHESGILDRHFGEIAGAIEAVLTGDGPRADPRIVAALEQAIAAARRKPYGRGAAEALEAVRLIGKCRSAEAAQALARLAADSDAAIRTAAADALGQLHVTTSNAAAAAVPSASRSNAATAAIPRVSPGEELLRILSSDPSAPARQQAATSLGLLDATESVTGLRTALTAESDPRVVDAIVQSLRRLGMPVDDSVQCRGLIGRAWEVAVAEQMLECWYNRTGTREDLMQAALAGPATQRAVALFALTLPISGAQPRTLVANRAPEPITFDPPVRDRLLDAAVEVLSQGAGISFSTRDRAQQALWNLSGMNMGRSLQYADRTTPNTARFQASASLVRNDPAAYDATRRRQQVTLALLIALGFGLVSIVRSSWRRPGVLLAASAAGWALWTLQANGVRDLPPPPLQLLSVAALGFFSAGVAAAGAAMLSRPSRRGRASIAIRAVLTAIAAGFIGAAVCGVTRNARLFPSDMEGWELIFDPLGAMILAVTAAAVLMAIDGLLSWARRS